jgi:phospholipid/cholesterol/gamma-HCH transport system ATP-binding protein
MIEVQNLSKTFNDRRVLSNINVSFNRGQTNLIIGQSGSGKTVLLKSIIGLVEPDEGDIVYSGTIFNRLNNEQKRDIRQQIGMLFQGGALFDFENVEGNIRYPLDMFTNMSVEEKRERVNFCLNRVNLVNVNKLYPSELSGGMQKRVAIARAIALNPKYLFCDEPNSGLDPKTAVVIDELIGELTEEYNMTTIINTHDMNSVMELGTKVIFIYQGRVEWEGSNNEILKSDNSILNEFVFASKLTKSLKPSHSNV